MSLSVYRALLIALGAGFTLAFCIIVMPALIADGDILGGFAAGFVNPYASGYSTDIFFTYAVLAVWVLYERSTLKIRHGWIALVVGVVPGVATGFALYLLIRLRQQ